MLSTRGISVMIVDPRVPPPPTPAVSGDTPARGDTPGPASPEPDSRTSMAARLSAASSPGLAALTEEEMELVRMHEENELLMEALVRVKLELAETQSEQRAAWNRQTDRQTWNERQTNGNGRDAE
jgi:hypothetical protein